MEKWKSVIIPLVIINFAITLIIFCYLILTEPYQKYDFKYDGDYISDIIGTVEKIEKRDDGIIMLVESASDNSTYDKAYITVTNKTNIIKTIYSRMFRPEEINLEDLVEVQFTGPVAESYPVQAIARSVWIKKSNVK